MYWDFCNFMESILMAFYGFFMVLNETAQLNVTTVCRTAALSVISTNFVLNR